jgi:uncharacterized protein
MKFSGLRFAMPALFAILAAAGCSPLAPRPDLTKFYLLTAAPDPGLQSPTTSLGRTIGLGPVHFPDYLSRDQVVTRVSPNQVEVSDVNRWAESLDRSFAQVLAADLAKLLPSDHFVSFPWSRLAAIDYQLRVDVSRFEADRDGNAYLSARWTLTDLHRSRQALSAESHLKESINAGEAAGDAAALSRVLGQFSRQVAERVRQFEAG